MPEPPITLAALGERLLAIYAVAGRSPRTIAKLRSILKELIATIAEDPAAEARVVDLTTAGIARWMALMCPQRSPNTTIGLLGYVRSVVSYAEEEGLVERPPAWRRLRPRRVRPGRVRHYPAAKIAELLALLEAEAPGNWQAHRLHVLVALVAYTGLRRDEALFLRKSDLHLDRGYLEVLPHHRRRLKTEESAQPVPVPPELVPIIEGWLPRTHPRLEWVIPQARGTGPWWGGSPGYRPIDRLREAGRRVGLEALSFRALRTSWACHAETLWGLTDPEIMRVLRHSTVDTGLRHYREADLANLRRIAGRVTYRPQAG